MPNCELWNGRNVNVCFMRYKQLSTSKCSEGFTKTPVCNSVGASGSTITICLSANLGMSLRNSVNEMPLNSLFSNKSIVIALILWDEDRVTLSDIPICFLSSNVSYSILAGENVSGHSQFNLLFNVRVSRFYRHSEISMGGPIGKT